MSAENLRAYTQTELPENVDSISSYYKNMSHKWGEVYKRLLKDNKFDPKATEEQYKKKRQKLLDQGTNTRLDLEFLLRKIEDPELTSQYAIYYGLLAVNKAESSEDPAKIENAGFLLMQRGHELNSLSPFTAWLPKFEYEEKRKHLSHSKIAASIPKDRLLHNPTAIRVAGGWKRKSEKSTHQDPYDEYRFIPVIEKALAIDEERFVKSQVEKVKNRDDSLSPFFGEGIKPSIKLSPSSSDCLRREGYRLLGYEPALSTTETRLAKLIGSSSHYGLERVLRGVLPSDIVQIEIWTSQSPDKDILGRLDVLYFNPRTREHQVVDLKFVSDYAFKQIKREGLSTYMRKTKNIYNPRPGDKQQVLIYMGDKRDEGLEVRIGNIIYINVSTRKMKEAMIEWDENESRVKERVQELHIAKQQIEKGKLPKAETDKHCEYCWFIKYCEEGQAYLSSGKKLVRKRPLSQGIRAQIAEKRREAKQKREDLGLVQPQLLPPVLDDEIGR